MDINDFHLTLIYNYNYGYLILFVLTTGNYCRDMTFKAGKRDICLIKHLPYEL